MDITSIKNQMKHIILPICLFLIGCETTWQSKNRSLLKEYAFCKCLQFASNDSLKISEDLSISIYRDISHYDFSIYDKIDSLAKAKAKSILPSIIADHEGRKAIILNCFEFYNSKSLDSIIKTFDNKMIKNW
jgi:hypothetical protein